MKKIKNKKVLTTTPFLTRIFAAVLALCVLFPDSARAVIGERPLRTPITKEILTNGLTVLMAEEHSTPLVSIAVGVRSGLSSEGEYAGSGISHFLEHMAFKGTAKLKSGQIEEVVKSYGGTINASTSLDNASYYITVPKEHAGEALLVMEDIVFHPAFDKDEFEKERSVILKEIKLNYDDPSRRVMSGLWETAYLAHPYKLPIIGYEALFKALTHDDLVKYHALRYRPENIEITIVGDFDSAKFLPHVKKTFGKYKRKGNAILAVTDEPPQNSPRELRAFTPINLGYLAMGYHTVQLTNEDLYALDVLSILLGNWDGSRLNKELVKKSKLLHTVSALNYTPKYPGLFIIYGVGDPENLEEAKKRIMDEVHKISTFELAEGELTTAKNTVIANYINSLETTAGLARAVSQSEFLAGDPAFFEKYVGAVKKVDPASVARVAKKYLRDNNLTVSYLYPESAKHLSAGEVLARAPSSAEGTHPGLDKAPQKYIFPNGVRLILKEERRLPKISIVTTFLGGVMVENPRYNGISNLTSIMLLKGTKKRTEDQITGALESRGGGISVFSGKSVFGISMHFLSDEKNGALDIFEDIIKNSVFPEVELEKEKTKIYAAIKAQNDDIYDTGFLKLREALFKDYPYGLRVIGEFDSVKRITSPHVRNFYNKYGVARNMVISVVGDFDLQATRVEFERRFGRSQTPSSDITIGPPPPLAGIVEANETMKRAQSLVVSGFRGASFNDPDRFSVEILCSVLSGENGRLYKTIRNDLGLAYALGTFYAPAFKAGYFASYVATDRRSLRRAKDILLKELKKVRAGDIDEEEVTLAKRALIGEQTRALQKTSSLAYKMALDEIFGLGYNAYEKYSDGISGVTREDVLRAAKKYIDLENFGIVTIVGEGSS